MNAPLEPIGGPYRAPECKVGDRINCNRRGKVTIAGFTDAPVRWPFAMSQYDRPSLIVCGDLVLAVRAETAVVVAYLFGVSPNVVTQWRFWLGVKHSAKAKRPK